MSSLSSKAAEIEPVTGHSIWSKSRTRTESKNTCHVVFRVLTFTLLVNLHVKLDLLKTGLNLILISPILRYTDTAKSILLQQPMPDVLRERLRELISFGQHVSINIRGVLKS